MSKFEAGDRVVIVKNLHVDQVTFFLYKRGTVKWHHEKEEYEVGVVVDGDSSATFFDAAELELESVYEALSAKPVEETSPIEAQVDSRLEDVVNHPSHYADGWSNGAEVVDITEHLNFNRGNAVKYLSRAGKKGGPEKELEDLQKALWYVTREVQRLGGTVG